MAKIKILTARQVNTLETGFHSDGGNLYLRVRDTGGRAWVFRYKLAGKVVELGLGPVVDRSLSQARELAGKMRTALADGLDPAGLVRVKHDPTVMTFKDCALALIESKRSGWRNAKHVQQWENTLASYAYPTIGGKLPADVSLADVLAILRPLWSVKAETATRLRQRVESVLDYAAVHEGAHGRYNPARWKANLDTVLPEASNAKKRVHHAAAPYADVPGIMSALRGKDCLSAYCLRFTVLTAARSGEARGALWNEIDAKAAAWVIGADRMKAGLAHRVPLCDEALEILAKMQEWRRDDADRVFPGARGGLLSDVAINKTLHAIAPEVTCHGFRASFRMWGATQTAFPSEALELALAHVNKDKVEAAYQRDDLFDRRVGLMTAWGRYCADVGNVVQIVKDAA